MNEAMLTFVKEYEELFKTSNWTEIYKRLHEKIANGGFQAKELDVGPFTLALKDLGIYPHLNPKMTELPWCYLRRTSIPPFKLPSHIKVIGPGAFLECGVDEVDINEGCEIISDNAFYNCYRLSSITFPASLTYIGDGAVSSCHRLKDIIFLGNNVTFISHLAFAYNTAVEELYLPHGLTKLGDRVFQKNVNLKTLSLPDTLGHIGEYCFDSCENLTTVEMKLDKITFGKRPFSKCNSLETITHRGPKAEVIRAGWPAKSRWRETSSIRRIQCDDGVIELE